MIPEDEDLALLEELPADEAVAYHEGLGHMEPNTGAVYGKRKVIGWLPYNKYTRNRAALEFARRGTKYEELFPTARFWCAAVYE